MASQFQIRTKDIPLLVRALQSLETVPDTWFGSVDDPSLISEMKNAARALPVKLRLKTLQLSSLLLSVFRVQAFKAGLQTAGRLFKSVRSTSGFW